MIAAAHFDNFLFLIFFAVAILFQLLTRAASKTGRRKNGNQNAPPQTPRPMPRQPQESEEDRIRKFLEALGQPTGSEPPPPVRQRPTYQKPIVVPRVEPRQIARRILAPLPPLTTRPAELESEGSAPQRHFSAQAPQREQRVFPPRPVQAFEAHKGPPPLAMTESETARTPGQQIARSVSAPEAKLDIATLLKSTSGLRNAMILREIFGPPRSMQPLDLVGNV